MQRYKTVKEFFDEPVPLKTRLKVRAQFMIINIVHYLSKYLVKHKYKSIRQI